MLCSPKTKWKRCKDASCSKNVENVQVTLVHLTISIIIIIHLTNMFSLVNGGVGQIYECQHCLLVCVVCLFLFLFFRALTCAMSPRLMKCTVCNVTSFDEVYSVQCHLV